MNENKHLLSIIGTELNKLQDIAIKNGQLIFLKDKGRIVFDLNDRRTFYDSISILETEEENELWKYVKAADKLSALIKCLEEEQMGNSDFADAKLTIEEYLKNMNMKEVDFFMEKFLPAYSMTLDESVTRLEG